MAARPAANRPFLPWLYRLTAHVALMSFREKKLATDWLESPAETDNESGSARHEIEVIDLHLTGFFDRINLQAAIEQLPEGYKAMFLLHDVYGYDHNAIASMRGCSVGSSNRNCTRRANDCTRSCAVATLAPNEATVDEIDPVRFLKIE
jgi:DNA-directed RNA polymerase specialized sigma24 family protein